MKRVTVTMTDDEYHQLKLRANSQDTTPSKLLSGFVADLTYSERRGGSDESDYANDWLDRQTYRDWTGVHK